MTLWLSKSSLFQKTARTYIRNSITYRRCRSFYVLVVVACVSQLVFLSFFLFFSLSLRWFSLASARRGRGKTCSVVAGRRSSSYTRRRLIYRRALYCLSFLVLIRYNPRDTGAQLSTSYFPVEWRCTRDDDGRVVLTGVMKRYSRRALPATAAIFRDFPNAYRYPAARCASTRPF